MLISKLQPFYVQMFHTFHTSPKRCGRLESSAGAALPYLPYLPYHFHVHTHGRAHAHARTHTRTCFKSSILVWKVWKVWKNVARERFAGSIPQRLGMEGMELC
jgi:hypothetical protein